MNKVYGHGSCSRPSIIQWILKRNKMNYTTMKSKFAALTAGLALLAGVVSATHAAPIVYEGTLTYGVSVFVTVTLFSGDAGPGEWDFWKFSGTAGDSVRITLNATNPDMDPGMIVYFGE